jgi:hypothetical protein
MITAAFSQGLKKKLRQFACSHFPSIYSFYLIEILYKLKKHTMDRTQEFVVSPI